ncbi:MAG: hypothetical protein VYA67_01730 [Actinomycetota bacterium]|uniref:Lipoprotein n=1 Tax=Mycobacterium lentiflavum TaxID=141349 RepID=A0ABY3UQ11_MYCLN|nr:hypothetical protein [Mycobacterium lentiflavum]MEE3062671.1 hypothetical protein [Actinomycetota bacterium]ULP41540.1 hypothetical protein MJO58_22210 [Mycobacterium lentiflavum]
MKIVAIAAAIVAATIGCAPVANGITAEEVCRKTYNWPIPMPTLTGWSMEHTMTDSTTSCFTNISAIAPDGHDVMNDTINAPVPFGWWKIATQSPSAGTGVQMDAQIKLTVVEDQNAPGQ